MKNYLQGWQEASFFIDSLTRNDAKKFKLKHGEGKCPHGEHLVVREGEKPFCRKSQGRENEPVKPKKSNLGVILGTSIGGGLLLAGGATAIAIAGSKGSSSSNTKTTIPTNPKTNPTGATVTPDDYRRWADEEKEAGSKAEKAVTEKPKTESTKPPSATIKPEPATNSTNPATAEPKKQSTTPPTKTEPKTPTKQNPVTSNTENEKVKPPSATIKPNKQKTPQNPKTSVSTGTPVQSPVTTKPKESKLTSPSATIKPEPTPISTNPAIKNQKENVSIDNNKKLEEKKEQTLKQIQEQDIESSKPKNTIDDKKKKQKGEIAKQEDGIEYVQSLNNDPTIYGAIYSDGDGTKPFPLDFLHHKQWANNYIEELPNKKEVMSKLITSYKNAKLRSESNEKQEIPLGRNRFAHFFFEELGLTGSPQNLSSEDMNKAIQDGSLQLFRGMQVSSNEQMKFAQDQYRNGDYYIGDGILGKGTYWAVGDELAINDAKTYATEEQTWNSDNITNFENTGSNRSINRGAIDKSAKLIEKAQLTALAFAIMDKGAEYFGIEDRKDISLFNTLLDNRALGSFKSQIGIESIAAILGFDGVITCYQNEKIKDRLVQEVNLFNRSKLLLDETTYYV